MSEIVALVTGGSRGIGAACAIKLGKMGFRVAVHYRGNAERAQAVCQEVPGSKAFGFDLSEEGAAEELIKAVKADLGAPGVLVNNAGIAIDQILPMAKLSDFDQLIATNLRPVFILSKLAAKDMMRKKEGRIINLSSVVGYTGNMGQSMYAATKGAITSFTKSIAQDLGRFGILANCVAPGFISTDMTDALPQEAREAILSKIPLGRLGRTDEIADAVGFLASPLASYITGTTIHVNGGMFTS